ncbi:MAG: hypothetical protein EWV58_13250 [Microcystis aeruginosa Ma_MB_F_20061100_S19]|uniref:Uncharacterized protein n=1 Tax=Microcystis aeruginosa SPC777 TaxID=482300 RepID=S3J371_MICAE|nr:hypothetical protein [Microcystis aeruginosa]NCR97264.1 hypothetical protein [Microcystis aeruginosa L311-01]OCY15673.1 MAG: hypothetical protein BEV12_13875 [Microcystis aeruginosa CACIAM 03]TRU12938.1 MAG: hypothetical protein EWV59_07595 [Microcystis aeruginosa Ma_MB_F_20061100_S19D]TRU14012.1 MAG: hypothetical protein EWV58_13250 [Microcystis aeruginosa Ma_MB_F_20061100_S19]EPF19625.1 hypothetical protein MAESPC_03761 [Microcystis aeruginosa SPC777]
MTNLSIQDRINQELNKILQALQQLEIFLRELSNQSDVMYRNAEEKVLIIAHQIVNSYRTIINDIQLFCNNLSKGET